MKNSTTKFTKWFVITVLLAQTILFVESTYFSIKDKKQLYVLNSVYDLMSQDIKTQELVAIKRPIDRLKLGVKLNEDPEYWKNSNLMPENKKIEF